MVLNNFFPTIPGNLHCISQFFAATIFYHTNFLKQTLSPYHPFFLSLLLTSSKILELNKRTSVNYVWEECSDISVYRRDNDSLDSDLPSIIGDTGQTTRRDSLGNSASLEPQETGASIPRRTLLILKATGIPTHVMLLADMQRVIES